MRKSMLKAAVLVGTAMAIAACASGPNPSGGFAAGSLQPCTGGGAAEAAPSVARESTPTETDGPPDYVLVWSDEFDYEGAPDPAKWGYDVGGQGWGNQELQYYTDEGNARVADGILTITARKEDHGGNRFTSARLVTRNKGDWLHGKIEVRARLPHGRGTWPAIWMLPTDWAYGGWPASGEIDIMEHVGYDPEVVHGSVHTDRYNHTKGTQITGTVRVPGATSEFHTYAIEWFEDRIEFFVDGEQYLKFDPYLYRSNPGYREWPFDRRFHLLLNIAVGGTWGGAEGVDENIWPATMDVDYVRVYQDRRRLED